MSKTNEKGPKQVDKGAYKDLMKEHAEQHANFIANSSSYNPSDSPVAKDAWRKNFSSYDQSTASQQQYAPVQQQYIIEE